MYAAMFGVVVGEGVVIQQYITPWLSSAGAPTVAWIEIAVRMLPGGPPRHKNVHAPDGSCRLRVR
jgi:hypothetical protein